MDIIINADPGAAGELAALSIRSRIDQAGIAAASQIVVQQKRAVNTASFGINVDVAEAKRLVDEFAASASAASAAYDALLRRLRGPGFV